MIKRTPCFVLFTVLMLSIYQNALATLDSATITQDTLNALSNCQHFRVLGACVWYSQYTGYSETLLVEEYLPDVVVTVFNKPGDNPWGEMNNTLDQAGKAAEQQIVTSLSHFDAGSGQHSFEDIHEQSTYFKEAEIIGNPALNAMVQQAELSSAAIPLNPYYQSMLDAAMWRGFPNVPGVLAEEGYAMVADLTRHVGTGLIDWGGIYPHEGKINSTNEQKAAAVIAQRAGDLITSTSVTGHIFQPLPNLCGEHCQAASIQENSPKTQFQLIYPTAENSCDYFGRSLNYGEGVKTNTEGAYSWVIWRYYRGCQNGTGVFVKEIAS